MYIAGGQISDYYQKRGSFFIKKQFPSRNIVRHHVYIHNATVQYSTILCGIMYVYIYMYCHSVLIYTHVIILLFPRELHGHSLKSAETSKKAGS